MVGRAIGTSAGVVPTLDLVSVVDCGPAACDRRVHRWGYDRRRFGRRVRVGGRAIGTSAGVAPTLDLVLGGRLRFGGVRSACASAGWCVGICEVNYSGQ